MKKNLTLAITALFMTATFVSCNDNESEPLPGDTTVAVASVSLNPTTGSIVVGGNLVLTATILPENATNQSVTWASSATAVATVENGVVTAVSEGTATITVTTADGDFTATSAITVIPPPVESISLNETTITLVVGDEFILIATVLPENAENKTVTWLSSNSDVVTVEDGVLTATAIGVANITATTEDGNRTANTTIAVVGTQQGCNFDRPGWGENLGTVSFQTNETWMITDGTITQIWSDAVTATNCQKTDLSGASEDDFNADCRSNPDFPGDFFSWCAVVRFADQLCPYPWRVPTTEDFINLDIAMGGTGNPRSNLDFVNANYIIHWGGRFGGASDLDGVLLNQGLWGFYWSQSESTFVDARTLLFNTAGNILPQGWANNKSNALIVRCVRTL